MRSAVIAVALSAAAYYVSTGLNPFWPVAWVAPLPILVFAYRTSPRATGLAAGSAYFLGSLNLFSYLTQVIPLAVVILQLLVLAGVFAAAVLLTRLAVLRLTPVLAALVFPATWTSFEFVLSRVSPHGTALSLAYSQVDVLPLLQVASVGGIWPITFIVTLLQAAASIAWTRRAPRVLVPAGLAAVAIVACGAIRLGGTSEASSIRVGLTATDEGLERAFATEDVGTATAVSRAYADRIRRLGAMGATVVVLPEKFVGVTPDAAPVVADVFSAAARDARVVVVSGFNRIGSETPRNVAAVFGSDGDMLTEYDKHHLLPGPETGYAVGTRPGVFSADGQRWGVAICKDLDFPPWARRYGDHGVRIMAAPSWDFVVDARLHSRMAVVRGVENGFTLVRVAQQGLLTVSDAYGRIVAEETSARMPEALLVADAPLGPGPTFYTRAGDWFGWASLAGCVLLLVLTARAPFTAT